VEVSDNEAMRRAAADAQKVCETMQKASEAMRLRCDALRLDDAARRERMKRVAAYYEAPARGASPSSPKSVFR
jgi:hypothetical protein